MSESHTNILDKSEVHRVCEELRSVHKTACPNVSGEKLEAYWQTLCRDGVVQVENVFSHEQINAFLKADKLIFDHVMATIATGSLGTIDLPWPIALGGQAPIPKKTYKYEGRKIITLGNGERNDIQWGYHNGLFADPAFQWPPIINSLVKRALETDIYFVPGSLPLAGKNNTPQEWHRDTAVMFPSEPNLPLNLPHFFINLFIPLQDSNVTNGITEFRLGTHKVPDEYCDHLPVSKFDVKVGSVLLADARTIHRGPGNPSDQRRHQLYVTYSKHWYMPYDMRDDLHYISPELISATKTH